MGNNPINWIDPWGLDDKSLKDRYDDFINDLAELIHSTLPGGGVAVGASGQVGAGTGATGGKGLVITFNWADLVQIAPYTTKGIGSYFGYGGGVQIDVAKLPYTDPYQFEGDALVFGGSGNVYGIVSAGGDLVIPLNGETPYFSGNVGVSGPLPGEGHIFYVRTDVGELLYGD